MKEQKKYLVFSCINRSIILILFVILFITIQMQVQADTIIDTVYAIGPLTGTLNYSVNYQSVFFNDFEIVVGDLGEPMTTPPPPDPNSSMRGYISFELPEIPQDYSLSSSYIRFYQKFCWGNSTFNVFPIWNVAGGDTMFCIMDHIDYGDYIDPEDWSAGDPGDPQTLCSNIGVISDSAEAGFRHLDITQYVNNDYVDNRLKTQYRLRFPVKTDWDSLYDFISFNQGLAPIPRNPRLVLHFSSLQTTDENNTNTVYKAKVYPNPFTESTTIYFNLNKNITENLKISIYNIKGEKIKTLPVSHSQSHTVSVVWDGRNSRNKPVGSGIYFIKLRIAKSINLKKVIKIGK
ncbi:MAG: T9SS type A sorting domain-containing protein [Candidatus Cloacimonetes bacterium]|nr:T9SS type A sorting domain-containing protein [Candidatus Cloacimonadota bacterium]